MNERMMNVARAGFEKIFFYSECEAMTKDEREVRQ